MTTGEKFKIIRTELKLTQEDFAFKVGLSSSNLALIETGRNNCKVEHLETLFNKLNINSIWFFENRGPVLTIDAQNEMYLSINEFHKAAYYSTKLEALALLSKFVLLESQKCKEKLGITDTELKVISDHTISKHPFGIVSIDGSINLNGKPFFAFNPQSTDKSGERGQS